MPSTLKDLRPAQLVLLVIAAGWISLFSFHRLFPNVCMAEGGGTGADYPLSLRPTDGNLRALSTDSFLGGWEEVVMLKPTPLVMHGAQVNIAKYPPLGDFLSYAWYEKQFVAGSAVAWEPETFKVFDLMISKKTTHIDFGTWVGPTLLYAASRAKRAIGLECDPFALMAAQLHVRANPKLAHKVSVAPLCISDREEKMKMSGFGGSGSTIEKVSGEAFKNAGSFGASRTWEVECVPLNYILESQHIRGDVFIKIDTEGAEAIILPQLLTWVGKLHPKPSLFVSFHNHMSKLGEKPEVAKDIVKLFGMYKYAVEDLYRNPDAKLRAGSEWTAPELMSKYMPDILLTDSNLPKMIATSAGDNK